MKASVCVFINSTCAMHLLTTLVRDKLKLSATNVKLHAYDKTSVIKLWRQTLYIQLTTDMQLVQ